MPLHSTSVRDFYIRCKAASKKMDKLPKKSALIIGVNSQDGYYLCRHLLKEGYFVFGTVRNEKSSAPALELLEREKFQVLHLDLQSSDSVHSCLMHVLEKGRNGPLEVYCLAAVSQVSTSVSEPVTSADTNALGPLRVLDSIFRSGQSSEVRFIFASSSEIFGNPQTSPQDEDTFFKPVSPYGMAKLFVMQQVGFQREYRQVFACSAILYNHESVRRQANFVTRKISLSASAVSKGILSYMEIGNLDAKRDWGHAEDYVRAMWMILQEPSPQDYVVGSGILYTVRELVEEAFNAAGIYLSWKGNGLDEVGLDSSTGIVRVKVNPAFYRPEDRKATELTKVSEPGKVVANNSKLIEIGWTPQHSFHQMIRDMVQHDLVLSESVLMMQLMVK
jgi:GDPmannose 4,6-dehydratase